MTAMPFLVQRPAGSAIGECGWIDDRELQIEHDLLKTASELIKKDLGGDLQGQC